MGKVLLEEQSLIDIANSIRNKTKSTETMKPSEMATNIDSIESGGGDLSEYFDDSITSGSSSTPGWIAVIKKLPAIPLKTSSSAAYTFKDFKGISIDLSMFDTSKIKNMSYMFNGCIKLTSLDLSKLNVSLVTNMEKMFFSCYGFTELDLSVWTNNVLENASQMFRYCSKLITLNLSSFNFENLTSIGGMFDNCTALTNLTFGTNLGKGYTEKTANNYSYKLDLSDCTLLTHDSLMDVINKLYDLNLTYDVANGGTLYNQQLVLGSTNLAKLTEEEKAIATNKGWTLS